MGCCLSAGDHPKTEHHHPNGGAPPLEEETVKEVLLETPIIPKAVSVDEKVKEMPPRNEEWRVEVGSAPVMNSNRDPPRINNEEIISEVSEISEMYSISESFSNTTAQEKRDDDDEDGEVNQRPPARKRRRPARGRGRGRGRGERVTPRRTAAPSPENKGQVAPLRPSRGRPMVGQPRNAAEVNGRRKDLGEGSGRRSTSPVRSEEKETSARRDVSEEDKSVATRKPPPDDVVAAEEAESLENPVAALNSRELNKKNEEKGQSHAEGLNVRGRTNKRDQKKKDKRSRSKSKSKIECYHCHKEGHIRRLCPERQKKNLEKQKEQADIVVASDGYESADVLMVSSINSEREWILDSGCTFHMTPNKESQVQIEEEPKRNDHESAGSYLNDDDDLNGADENDLTGYNLTRDRERRSDSKWAYLTGCHHRRRTVGGTRVATQLNCCSIEEGDGKASSTAIRSEMDKAQAALDVPPCIGHR
ncbi:hypothetical protein BUALT_Bualt18G0022200 [Buddleja alternifolia]|uniref:CCHC-type domain-containing protein n=1 Tax=Buddleja alternifolia TaxID=168488 RepID=A0AAV6W9V7_9LAMI|nr:hypothetical protein BUALT_Bualt18G0022200 [Buddleja alternifolia]